MPRPFAHRLSRREQQIMDVVYRDGQATVASVLAALPDPPSYSSIRTLMRILEEKGHLRHISEGHHFVYHPVEARHSAARSALSQVIQTFFGGSIESAVATLLSPEERRLTDSELERLSALIETAKEEAQTSPPPTAETQS